MPAEGINLTQPYAGETAPATKMRFGSMILRRYAPGPDGLPVEAPYVQVLLVGDNGREKLAEWWGDDAKQIMGAINRANFSTVTLLTRVLERVQKDYPAMAGATTELPDDPMEEVYRSMTRAELLEEAANAVPPLEVEGTGADGYVTKEDLVLALLAAGGST